MLKTSTQVLQEFHESGTSIAEWARANGFNVNLVYKVLRGQLPGSRGQTHDISVRLKIKKGVERSTTRLAA